MLKISTKTKLSPEEAIKKAVEFLGPAGYGLEVREENSDCVYFEGGGVDFNVCVEEGRTSVDVEPREWDYQVKEFRRKL